jgi:hypothetical protein
LDWTHGDRQQKQVSRQTGQHARACCMLSYNTCEFVSSRVKRLDIYPIELIQSSLSNVCGRVAADTRRPVKGHSRLPYKDSVDAPFNSRLLLLTPRQQPSSQHTNVPWVCFVRSALGVMMAERLALRQRYRIFPYPRLNVSFHLPISKTQSIFSP